MAVVERPKGWTSSNLLIHRYRGPPSPLGKAKKCGLSPINCNLHHSTLAKKVCSLSLLG